MRHDVLVNLFLWLFGWFFDGDRLTRGAVAGLSIAALAVVAALSVFATLGDREALLTLVVMAAVSVVVGAVVVHDMKMALDRMEQDLRRREFIERIEDRHERMLGFTAKDVAEIRGAHRARARRDLA